jgi:hypothetical protein
MYCKEERVVSEKRQCTAGRVMLMPQKRGRGAKLRMFVVA